MSDRTKIIYDVASKDKGYCVAFDLKSVPVGPKAAECLNDELGVIYWDSSLGGLKPEIVHLGGDKFKERKDYKIIDLANKPNE